MIDPDFMILCSRGKTTTNFIWISDKAGSGLRFAILLERCWSGRLQSTAPWPERELNSKVGLYHVIKIPENRKSQAWPL